MEGNLYHLIKARKGRSLAGGLVASIFHQITAGLHHIHSNGYFHRDMKPENVLVTTTGLFDYTSVSPVAPPNAPKEKDVVAIIKLADFGLARETKSKPPYTDYVSTRWYRAPEVLLLGRDYSNPVDMWALGTIMAELVSLRPLFPGANMGDQVGRICEVLGDPSDYGVDETGSIIGGGPWPKGHKLAADMGFQFDTVRPFLRSWRPTDALQIEPKDFFPLFDRTIPRSLIQCIRDLLRYDPSRRLTSQQCLEHPYLLETLPRNNITLPVGLTPSNTLPTARQPPPPPPPPASIAPPSHHQNTHRTPFPVPVSASNSHPPSHHPYEADRRHWPEPQSQADYSMDVTPPPDHPVNGDTAMVHDLRPQDAPAQPAPNKLAKFGFGKKHNKWGLGMFGGEKAHHSALPPVDESSPAVVFTSTRKRTQSLTSNRSMRDVSPPREPDPRDIKKQNKKEAERLHKEAEKEKHRLREQSQKEMARAVMQKRRQIVRKTANEDIDWRSINEYHNGSLLDKTKQPSHGPIRSNDPHLNGGSNSTVNAASGKFIPHPEPLLSVPNMHEWRGPDRMTRARRREYDDDHSMSSSDMHSISRRSSISYATVDSDPGPSRLRNRPSLFGISRMTSRSSLRTSFDDFSPSVRSSNSFSLEGQLAHDFRTQASLSSQLSGSVSPPPLHSLSLSPNLSPSSPSTQWVHLHPPQEKDLLARTQSPPYLSLSPHFRPLSGNPHSPLDLNSPSALPPSPYHPPSSYSYTSSADRTPKSSKSLVNPIFKVVSHGSESNDGLVSDGPTQPPDHPPLPRLPGLAAGDAFGSTNSLPPFSALEAVAGAGEVPPHRSMIVTDNG